MAYVPGQWGLDKRSSPSPSGDFLRTIRRGLGMTQRQLADALWVDRQRVIAWETGRSAPSNQALRRFHQLMATPMAQQMLAHAGVLPLTPVVPSPGRQQSPRHTAPQEDGRPFAR
ncbi:MAG: hypothetical protein CL878_09555 [Dehalococcoidia bacterium]|nr:hypothetical protein [Dehalococcoidia bacterium]